jgi:hypothetical protein
LIEAAARRLLEQLKGLEGVAILAPCGCSRAVLLKLLMKPGEQAFSKAYAYRGFREKAGGLQDVEEYASLEKLVEELERWSGGRVAVVPESSWEADALKRMLEEARLRAQLVYLPKLYEEALKELGRPLDERVVELARVEHGGRSGVSLKLLRPWSEEELEELKRAKEAVLKLSPGKLGLKDYLGEAAGKALFALAAAPFGAAVALAVESLLETFSKIWLHDLALMLLRKVGKIPVERVEGLASRIVEGWARPQARDQVAKGFAKLASAAKEASRYLDGGWLEDALEAVWDQVALEWGMGVQEFKALVRSLAALARGELATRDDLRRELEKLAGGELERRLAQLIRERLTGIEEELRVVEVGLGLHFTPESLGVLFDEEGILLRNVLAREGARYVPHPCEEELREAFEKVRGGGVVVVRGRKGEGKSSLAKAFLAKLMAREPTAVIDMLDAGGDARDVGALKNVIDRVRDANRNPVLFYDPSKAEHYPTGSLWSAERSQYKPQKGALAEAAAVISDLATLVVEKRVPAIVVLSDDLYELVKEQLRKIEAVDVEVSLENEEGFLEELVEVYSAAGGGTCCGKDAVRKVARAVATFEDNRAVAAVLAADWLKRRCEPEAVVEALQKARKKVEGFVIDYIWRAVLKEDRALANTLAPLLILAGIYGSIPRKLGEELLIALGVDRNVVSGNEAVKWLSQPLHTTVWSALRNFIFSVISGKEVEAHGSLAEAIRETLRVLNIDSLISKVCSILKDELGKLQPSCWRRLALIAGLVFAGRGYMLPEITLEQRATLSEALKPCEVDNYLVVGGEIPPLIIVEIFSRLDIFTYHIACRHIDAAEEIKKLKKIWYDRDSFYPDETLYALGLALAVVEAKKYNKEVKVWEAEAALFAAAVAVQQVLMPERVSTALEVFKPLSELAPHYYLMLAGAAFKLKGLSKRTIRETLEIIDKIVDMIIVEEETLCIHKIKLNEEKLILLEAIDVYSSLLTMYIGYCIESLEQIRDKMCKILKRLDGQLLILAETLVLLPVLEKGLQPCEDVEAARKAWELLKKLEKLEMEKPSQQAAEWSKLHTLIPNGFKHVVRVLRGQLVSALAHYMKNNDDLDEAEKLFENAAAIAKEYDIWMKVLVNRSLAARCSVLKAGSLNELRKNAKVFDIIWNEAEKHEILIAGYLESEAYILAEYLIYLALEGKVNEIFELLKKKGWILKFFPLIEITVKLFLKYLGVNIKKIEEHRFPIVTLEELFVFVEKQDVNTVPQFLVPRNSLESFILMLWALINGDKELARDCARLAAVLSRRKLHSRLFHEAAEARSEDELKLALLKLFYLHI